MLLLKNTDRYIHLSKAQLWKISQFGGFLCNMLGNSSKDVITGLVIPLARDNFPVILSNLASNAINKFGRKISGKVAVRAGKRITVFISNEDMNDIIRIIKSLVKSLNSLVQPVISSVVKGICGREVTRAEKGYINEKVLVPLYPWSSIEINIYFNCQPRFNLPRIYKL